MLKMEFLDPLIAEKFKKQKCIQFCWTPCSILPERENIPRKNHSCLTVFRLQILVSDCLKIAEFSVPIGQVCWLGSMSGSLLGRLLIPKTGGSA